jgi:TolB-like protein/class 3 adenylate cyclase
MPAPQTSGNVARKLAAILSADVARYSRLMEEDEVGTIRTLNASRAVTDSLIAHYHGRIVSTAGDSILAEFASAVAAVLCALEIQQALKAKNADLPAERRMEFRIGINVGDVVVEGEQIYGDGVNIAARLQSLADVGGIFISGTVYDQVKNKLALHYDDLGEQAVKNIAAPVRMWWVVMDEAAAALAAQQAALRHARPESRGGGIPLLSRPVLVFVLVSGLLFGGTVAVRYLLPSLPNTQHSAPSPSPLLGTQDSALRTAAAPAALPLPHKPSLVVLPLTNMSGDPEQEYFSDGITEDLIAGLSNLSGLFVISRHSAFTYKGKAVKIQDVGRDLGVRYVLEGSVRKSDGQVRITVQLIDATTGGHLWSGRYDRELKDIFALQEEITRKIVVHLALKLTDVEGERLEHLYTSNPEAYDYRLRGLEYLWHFTKETSAQARQMFERAIELDPTYAVAYSLLGWTYLWEWGFQWSQDPQNLEQAFALAQKALALDDSHPQSHELLGLVHLLKNKQPEQAVTEMERAVALSPKRAALPLQERPQAEPAKQGVPGQSPGTRVAGQEQQRSWRRE